MFPDEDSEFEKHMSRAQRAAIFAFIAQFVIVTATLGFAGWVIVQVLQHFEII